MTFKVVLFFAVLFFSKAVYGQLSLINPSICHDTNNYLSCYNDGDYILTFQNGNFIELNTSDNSLKYSATDRRITFIHKTGIDSLVQDTVEILQLSKSIILRKRGSSLEITSLNTLPREIGDYGLSYFSVGNQIRGLTFSSGEKYIELEIFTFEQAWDWTIKMQENQRRCIISYNSFKKNRIQNIFIDDDDLRYGMVISMTWKTLKRVSELESLYVDTIGTLANGTPVIGAIPLNNYYKYEYGRNGKLKTENSVGELKLCDCK